MQSLSKLLLLISIFSVGFLTSCNDDDDKTPINAGASVTVTNTLQADATTNGVETTIEDLFMMAEGALAATATISEAVEFPGYLLGLYDINIDENTISFELVAPIDDPTYSSFYRTLEAGTTDRYYLTFTEAQNVKSFSSSNSSVSLRLDSDKVLVVEIGEGFSFNPGSAFTITLN